MTLFTSEQLSNEEYHALPEISGSSLVTIFFDCPAAYEFGEKVETKAMAEGTAGHAAILEPELFAQRYERKVEPLPGEIVTAKDAQAWLKDKGIKGYSNKTKPELSDMIQDADKSQPVFWDREEDQERDAEVNGREILKPGVFDQLALMRQTIFNDPTYSEKLTGAQFELSCVTNGVKARWDCVTKGGEIWDYKTTTSAKPEDFGRAAYNYGYWLKMALQSDVYEAEFGERPRRVVLLAQSKKSPYIPQAYELTSEQLQAGRDQYQYALDVFHKCLESNVWPAYGGGVLELPSPAWAV